MSDALFTPPSPKNEATLAYAPGDPARKELESALKKMRGEKIEIPLYIGSEAIHTGRKTKAIEPHRHANTLAEVHEAGKVETHKAIEAALHAKKDWERMPWEERSAIFLKAAELISTKYRSSLNAATMLNQSKTAHQAEIDAACEFIDFLRFNVHFVSKLYREQPESSVGVWNRTDYRPLEGFVAAITPFNFTAIAGNLPCSAALMGNTVVWKPSDSAHFSGYWIMKILQEAGLPDGVINFIPGPATEIAPVLLSHSALAGVHFTGSTSVFNSIWKAVANQVGAYKNYPRLVGETGGKDFVFVHPSAEVKEVAAALVRGAFEYQGQKCSAASRAYLPRSLWKKIEEEIQSQLSEIKVGDITDFSNFVSAVIHEKSFDKLMLAIQNAGKNSDCKIIAGGKGDKSIGYFIEPTIILCNNPHYETMREELFGPVLSVYVYEDKDYERTLELCDTTSAYALTGAFFARDRAAILTASERLRFTAGNFYINDKPTGAVVGQQPFGGARASGTNDKAGSLLNLLRWTSPRTIKETLVPPTNYRYPFLG